MSFFHYVQHLVQILISQFHALLENDFIHDTLFQEYNFVLKINVHLAETLENCRVVKYLLVYTK